MIFKHITLIGLILFLDISFAQFNENNFGLSVNAVYTTSAEIFLNPNSSDPIVRNQSYTIEDIFNPSVDFRYKLTDHFILGLNIEYINKTSKAPNLTAFIGSRLVILEVEDGFRVIPIELTAHYYFPFSTDRFKFLMGGGLGYYRGEFVRKFSDVDLAVVNRKIALGIHVSASLDYLLLDNVSFRFEMKFRDPQYEVRSKYTKTEVIYQGDVITLPEDSFEIKVNMDGLTFLLGAVYHF
jgi:outer membrane protein W